MCPFDFVGAALSEAFSFFDDADDSKPNMLFYIPYSDVNDEALNDCDDDDTVSDYTDELDSIDTFALRFWRQTSISNFEDMFGDIEWCEFFQLDSYEPSLGNSQDARYFVNALAEFLCTALAADTDGMYLRDIFRMIYVHLLEIEKLKKINVLPVFDRKYISDLHFRFGIH